MVQSARRAFPSITARNWSALRKRFAQTMPRDVTPNYLATVLGDMSPDSARQNVLRPLRAVGLVGDDNKPTERATSGSAGMGVAIVASGCDTAAVGESPDAAGGGP